MKKSVSVAMVIWILGCVVSLSLACPPQDEKSKDAEKDKQAGAGSIKKIEKDAQDGNKVLNRMEKRNQEREARMPKGKVEEAKGLKEKGAAQAEEKGKEAVEKKGASAEKIGRGKEHQQQMQAREKQFTHEKSKHSNRVARLNRIRELAEKKGDTKTVQRVDALLAKEKERFTAKQDSIESKVEKTVQTELKEKEVKVKDVNDKK